MTFHEASFCRLKTSKRKQQNSLVIGHRVLWMDISFYTVKLLAIKGKIAPIYECYEILWQKKKQLICAEHWFPHPFQSYHICMKTTLLKVQLEETFSQIWFVSHFSYASIYLLPWSSASRVFLTASYYPPIIQMEINQAPDSIPYFSSKWIRPWAQLEYCWGRGGSKEAWLLCCDNKIT